MRVLLRNITKLWSIFFKDEITVDFDQPLTTELVINPSLKVVTLVTFIYSMETHLPYLLNTASRDWDESKIETLGPLSIGLTLAVACIEGEYRKDDKTQFSSTEFTPLFRGSTMTDEDIQEYIDSKD